MPPSPRRPVRIPSPPGAATATRARAPLALRAALVLGLAVLLALGLPEPATRGTGDVVVRLAGGADDAGLATALLDPTPRPVFLDAGAAPSELEIQALAGVAARTELFVALPFAEPTLAVTAPETPLTGRYGAVRFRAGASPGDTVTARLVGPGGATLDSARLAADAAGMVAGGFRVRPATEGWTEWRIEVAGPAGPAGPAGSGGASEPASARVGAWVAGAAPPRVLVVAGPPTWESRSVVRSLEGSGARVSLVQDLGRDNRVTGGGAPVAWGTAPALAAFDVVALLDGAAPDAAARAALGEWVAGGRGLLVATGTDDVVGAGVMGPGPAEPPAGPARPGGGRSALTARAVRGDSLAWSAPAAIVPLPAAALEAGALLGVSTMPGSAVVARSPGGDPLLVLAPRGRGRTAWLGLRETWRWTMAAGLETEHRAFWRSLVDWLAAPAADSLGVRVAPSEAPVGTTVDLSVRAGPARLDLELAWPAPSRVDGGARADDGASSGTGTRATDVPSAPLDPTDPTATVGRVVATDTGVHALRSGDRVLGAFRAVSVDQAGPADLARARLAHLAASSGGEALEPGEYAARLAGVTGGVARPGWWLPWVLGALAVVALGEWGLRRRTGLP